MSIISVILPVYNKELYIERCLNSIKNQNFDNFELVIVDDGSNDKSKDIIFNFLDDIRFKYFYKDNGGVISAIKFGIEKATSNYIAFVDADDYLGENYLLNFVEQIKSGYDVIAMGFTYVNHGTTNNFYLKDRIFYGKKIINDFIFNDDFCLNNDFFVSRWNKAYSKEVIDKFIVKYSKFDVAQVEDLAFNYFLLSCNPYIKSISKLSEYFYDISTESVTRTKKTIYDYFLIKEKIISFYKKNNNEYVYYSMFFQITLNQIYNLIENKCKNSEIKKITKQKEFYECINYFFKRYKFKFKTKIKYRLLQHSHIIIFKIINKIMRFFS